MKNAIMILAAILTLACTDEGHARKVLKAQGYTEIQTTGYEVFSCSEDDTVRTGFVAKSASGQRVEGVVCCGLVFKSCTVRVD